MPNKYKIFSICNSSSSSTSSCNYPSLFNTFRCLNKHFALFQYPFMVHQFLSFVLFCSQHFLLVNSLESFFFEIFSLNIFLKKLSISMFFDNIFVNLVIIFVYYRLLILFKGQFSKPP